MTDTEHITTSSSNEEGIVGNSIPDLSIRFELFKSGSGRARAWIFKYCQVSIVMS